MTFIGFNHIEPMAFHWMIWIRERERNTATIFDLFINRIESNWIVFSHLPSGLAYNHTNSNEMTIDVNILRFRIWNIIYCFGQKQFVSINWICDADLIINRARIRRAFNFKFNITTAMLLFGTWNDRKKWNTGPHLDFTQHFWPLKFVFSTSSSSFSSN